MFDKNITIYGEARQAAAAAAREIRPVRLLRSWDKLSPRPPETRFRLER